MAIYAYKIGVGWNLPEGSLVNVENINVPNTVLSLEDIISEYTVGDNTHYLLSGETPEENRVTTADAGNVRSGNIRKEWRMLTLSDVALQYWIDTYSGQRCTVKTTNRQFNTYERRNVQVGFPITETRHYLHGTWWYPNTRIPLMFIGGTL